MNYLKLSTRSARVNDAAARLAIRARALTGGRKYRRFVIVGVARTGSTLLLSLLNAQPRVLAFGEIFRGDGKIGWDTPPFLSRQSRELLRRLETEPLEFLDREVFGAWPREVAAVGFKLFYYHARSGPQAAVWDRLRDDPELAVIHIKRRNILEQYLSLRVAHATDVWSTARPPDEAPAPIQLDPDACRRHFEEIRAQEADCDAFFAGPRLHTLAYEDLVVERQATMEHLARHLGVRLEPVEARTARQRTQPLSSAIANFAELREAFAGSPWEVFFQQPDSLALGRRAA